MHYTGGMTLDGTPRDQPRIVALINQKGGVGKTTTAVNLAAGIAAMRKRTLLIDLDPQAHATLHLGIEPGTLDSSVYDLLLDPDAGVASALVKARTDLDVIPSETDLAAAELELAGMEERQRRLSSALRDVIASYEYVIIDCPPSLGLLTINGLAAAREVIVPTQAHFLALQGMGKLLETVALMTRSVNPSLRVSGVVLCNFDSQTTHSQEVLADMERFFKAARSQDAPWSDAKVYRPPVRRNIKLAECPSYGQTIFEYAPGAAGAEDYESLARAFVREWVSALRKGASTIEARPAASVHGPAGGA
jgi:chromosome partitioning protein